MKPLLILPLLMLAGAAQASEMVLPLDEHAFVERIGQLSKAAIVQQLGEPAKSLDLVSEETGEIAASIWHYNYLNTSDSGEYYKTTELNFVGDHVVNVVFSMTDESEASEPAGYLPAACTDCQEPISAEN